MTMFTVGTLLGVGLGMLVAPKRGTELVSDIRQTGKRATGKLRLAAQNAKSGVRDALQSTSDMVEDIKQ